MSGDDAISIFRRILDPANGTLTAAAAEAILQLRLPDADQRRMTELGDKSNHGTLTEVEGAEYDEYIAAADWLALLKSKARLSLKQHPSAA